MPFRFRRSIRIAPGIQLNVGRRGPFRFRHSFRIAPGIRLNIGKRGLSTSLGGRGARVMVGRNNPKATAARQAAASAIRSFGARGCSALPS